MIKMLNIKEIQMLKINNQKIKDNLKLKDNQKNNNKNCNIKLKLIL